MVSIQNGKGYKRTHHGHFSLSEVKNLRALVDNHHGDSQQGIAGSDRQTTYNQLTKHTLSPIRNSKSEYRNPKQIQNPNFQNTKPVFCLENLHFEHLCLFRISCFEFRISFLKRAMFSSSVCFESRIRIFPRARRERLIS